MRGPESLVQLRLVEAVTGVTVAFHEEQLMNEDARTTRKEHWESLLRELGAEVSRG